MINAATCLAAVVWVSLLLVAPALLRNHWSETRPIHYAGSATIVLATATGGVYVLGTFGVPSGFVLVPLCAILALCLLVAIGLTIRTRNTRERCLVPATLLLTSLAIAVWTLLPGLRAVRRSGIDGLGPVSAGNLDIFYYIIAAENLSTHGVTNSGLLADAHLGELAELHHITVPVLIEFVSAATGFSSYQGAAAVLGVAVFVTAISIWALGHAVWPKHPAAVCAATIVGSLSAITVYNVANNFIGAILATVAIAMLLAVAVELCRAQTGFLLTSFIAAGTLGVLGYPFITLPALLAIPIWALVTALVLGRRTWAELRRILAVVLAGVVGTLLLTSPVLLESIRMMSEWANTPVGWPLRPLTPQSITIWPGPLRKPENAAESGVHASYFLSWSVAVVGASIALILAARRERSSAVLSALAAAGFVVVTLGAVAVYGASYYNSWKMVTYIWPIACAIALPALWQVRIGPLSVGPHIVTGIAAITLLNPIIVWGPASDPGKTGAERSIRAAIEALPSLREINLRLPTLAESQMAAAELVDERTTVAFEQNSYLAPTSRLTDTCTLTTTALLRGTEAEHAVPLGDDYVLLLEPADCRRR